MRTKEQIIIKASEYMFKTDVYSIAFHRALHDSIMYKTHNSKQGLGLLLFSKLNSDIYTEEYKHGYFDGINWLMSKKKQYTTNNPF